MALYRYYISVYYTAKTISSDIIG